MRTFAKICLCWLNVHIKYVCTAKNEVVESHDWSQNSELWSEKFVDNKQLKIIENVHWIWEHFKKLKFLYEEEMFLQIQVCKIKITKVFKFVIFYIAVWIYL